MAAHAGHHHRLYWVVGQRQQTISLHHGHPVSEPRLLYVAARAEEWGVAQVGGQGALGNPPLHRCHRDIAMVRPHVGQHRAWADELQDGFEPSR